jgi:hypothetical protein
MTIITITASSKTSGKISNTSTNVEADNLEEYCNSTAIKLSNSRLGNLIWNYLNIKPNLAEVRDI